MKTVLDVRKKLLVTVFLCVITGLTFGKSCRISRADTLTADAIREELATDNNLPLKFPQSVNEFYHHGDYYPVWLKGPDDRKKTWEAMLLIDCVLQFGLSHDDYHPQELLYNKLHDIFDKPAKVSNKEKARFEILLTDAILTFTNHLHYGKLNPNYPASKIDRGIDGRFNAQLTLRKALGAIDFMSVIGGVQPTFPEYAALQEHMRLITGQLTGDCYEIPDSEVRRVAINMERLRWLSSGEPSYIFINIPSYSLKLYTVDSVAAFRVIVGKQGNYTPQLESVVRYFTTSPDWKVPAKIFRKELLPKALKDTNYLERNQFSLYDRKGNYIAPTYANLSSVSNSPGKYYAQQSSGCDNALGLLVFRFQNPYSIYLHDTPEKKLFNRNVRALSHGCIRVEQADKLAAMLLTNDGSPKSVKLLQRSMRHRQTKTFVLRKGVPIKIAYLTCEVVEGMLITYDDIYDKDRALEMALYNVTNPLVLR